MHHASITQHVIKDVWNYIYILCGPLIVDRIAIYRNNEHFTRERCSYGMFCFGLNFPCMVISIAISSTTYSAISNYLFTNTLANEGRVIYSVEGSLWRRIYLYICSYQSKRALRNGGDIFYWMVATGQHTLVMLTFLACAL